MSDAGRAYLLCEIQRVIDYSRKEFENDYTEVIGVLERIKHDMQTELDRVLYPPDDEDDDGEGWKKGQHATP